MGLSDVELRPTTNWRAFFIAVLATCVGTVVSAVSTLYGQIVVGVIVGIVCAIIGVFAGLRVQRTALIKSMKAGGSGKTSATAAVVISQNVGGTGRAIATAKVVPHSSQCAEHEKNCQAVGKTHYEILIQTGERCDCTCHQLKSNNPTHQPQT
jgi:hypothetical protein